MHRLTLDLPPETMAAVKRRAEERGISASELVLIIIDELIAAADAKRVPRTDEQGPATDEDWDQAVEQTFGIAPELPEGVEYQRRLRDGQCPRADQG